MTSKPLTTERETSFSSNKSCIDYGLDTRRIWTSYRVIELTIRWLVISGFSAIVCTYDDDKVEKGTLSVLMYRRGGKEIIYVTSVNRDGGFEDNTHVMNRAIVFFFFTYMNIHRPRCGTR